MIAPLQGKRILITRPKDQIEEWADRLELRGAIPVAFPLIAILAAPESIEVQDALSHFAECQWIVFTSVNAARYCLDMINNLAVATRRPNIAAIGSKTAAYLEEHGVETDFMPSTYTSANMAQEMGNLKGKKILLPRTNIADDDLSDRLNQKGALVKEAIVYITEKISGKHDELQTVIDRGLDVISFASPSAAEAFAAMDADPRQAHIACIGPVTAQRARELGLKVDIVGEKYTTEGLSEAMEEYFEEEKTKQVHR